jgi:hypothetical protein
MEEVIILGIIGIAAWLTFGGSSSSPVAMQVSPTPTTANTPTSTPGVTISSAGSSATSAPAAASGVASPGTNISELPASQVPPDSYFIAAGLAAYASGTGLAPTNKYYVDFKNMLTTALSSMQMSTAGYQGQDNCSSVTVPNISFSQAASLAGTGVSAGLGIGGAIGGAGSAIAGIAGAAVPLIGIGIGIVSLISAIFAHHAQKVKEQTQLDCATVNACNNAWANIASALESGQLSLADAYTAWESVYSQAAQQESAMSNGPKKGDCNNPCNLTLICRIVTNKWEALYGVS